MYGECRYQDLIEERHWRASRTDAGPRLVIRKPELGEIEASPDGTRIAYTVGRGDGCELMVADADGKRPTFVASRDYVVFGCSRGLHGMSVKWAPDSRVLYYTDGSSLFVWDAASARSKLLLRPPGSPRDTCTMNQSCLLHLLREVSSDGSWLILEQSDPYNYNARPTILLVDVRARTTNVLGAPRGRYELRDIRLD